MTPPLLRSRRAKAAITCAAWLATMPAAHGARPMVTDDARIVDAKACQVESWVRSYRDGGRELWALPGCNPTGHLEITLGGASIRPGQGGSEAIYQGQVKTLFKPLETDGWGIGLALGTLDTVPRTSLDRRSHPYFYLPVSVSFAGDRVVVHGNVGATRGPMGRSAVLGTWGLGAEIAVVPRALLVAEAYAVGTERTQGQLGVRLWVVPNRVQIDATVGEQGGPTGVGRWFSIGLRLLSPPFLP